jgi:hypothetical protein
MASAPASASRSGGFLVLSPLLVLIAGLSLSALGWLASELSFVPAEVRLLLIFAGTVLALVGVVHRLRQAGWDFPQRIESAALVSLAGLNALLGYLGMDKDWDSGQMFYVALFLLALAGALLLLLPSLARRIVISLFIAFHFGGMAVAVTSVDPPNGSGAWLSKQLWTWVYRPYLSFMYLTNAYHFYSPDPGPPGLLWFAVKYDDGSYQWVKLPDRANSPVGMHYQRMLALPEHTVTAMPRLPYSLAEVASLNTEQRVDAIDRGYFDPERGAWEEILQRRDRGSELLYRSPEEVVKRFPEKKALQIPMVIDRDAILQFREPTMPSKRSIVCVAQRVLWTTPDLDNGARPLSVKVYRVVHQVLTPYELSKGVSPYAKTKYWPYFLGEFDREGRLKDSKDPFLYWYLPIVVVPESYPEHGLASRPGVPAVQANAEEPKGGFLLDCMELHAAGPAIRQEKK